MISNKYRTFSQHLNMMREQRMVFLLATMAGVAIQAQVGGTEYVSSACTLCILALAAENHLLGNRHANRRAWALPRHDAWYDTDLQAPWFAGNQFLDIYHCHRSTFDYLIRELSPFVEREITQLRLPVPADKCIAICLDRLATGQSYRSLSRNYGVGVSTCQVAHGERLFMKKF